MRIYILLSLAIISTQAPAMLRRTAPVRPARPTLRRPTPVKPIPVRHYSEKSDHHFEERVNNMVSAIKASATNDSGRAHFINSLEQALASQIRREGKFGYSLFRYMAGELTAHQEILVEATIIYLDELQQRKK